MAIGGRTRYGVVLAVLLAMVGVSMLGTVGLADWVPYGNRYGLIVMGGNVVNPTYGYYWTDTSNMYNALKAAGFTDANIYFLSYGSSASGQTIVDRTSTRDNVLWALDQIIARSTRDDLVYVFWVDHGTETYFEVQGGNVTHSEFGSKVTAIKARQILIALNPCYSGCAIDDVSHDGVCVTSSVKCSVANRWGWAGQWILALTGGTADSGSDVNGDGVTFAEAFAWVAPRSRSGCTQQSYPQEHPSYDDNGDGQAVEQDQSGFSLDNPSKDGFIGNRFGLSFQNRTRQRAYLDYLILRKGQTADQLSDYFTLNFASYRPSVLATCVQKLEADLRYHSIVFVGEDDCAVRQRQYLDYLILRKGQPASQLSSYFGRDFASSDWDTMAWCSRKLEDDLRLNGISFRTAAQVESNDRQYLDYLIQRRGQSAATLTGYFKVSFSSSNPAEVWTCLRLLEKDVAVQGISFTARAQWEAAR
jgi:hypothetical protein